MARISRRTRCRGKPERTCHVTSGGAGCCRNISVPLWDYHRSNMNRGHECGHFCHPSAPQLYLYEMIEAIKQHVPPLPQQAPSSDTDAPQEHSSQC